MNQSKFLIQGHTDGEPWDHTVCESETKLFLAISTALRPVLQGWNAESEDMDERRLANAAEEQIRSIGLAALTTFIGSPGRCIWQYSEPASGYSATVAWGIMVWRFQDA